MHTGAEMCKTLWEQRKGQGRAASWERTLTGITLCHILCEALQLHLILFSQRRKVSLKTIPLKSHWAGIQLQIFLVLKPIYAFFLVQANTWEDTCSGTQRMVKRPPESMNHFQRKKKKNFKNTKKTKKITFSSNFTSQPTRSANINDAGNKTLARRAFWARSASPPMISSSFFRQCQWTFQNCHCCW